MSDTRPRIAGLWLLIALVAGVLIFGDLTRRMTDARRMEREGQRLASEVARLELANADLEEEIAHAGDDAKVADWARAQAKMVREGERLVVPLAASETVRPPGEEPAPAKPLPSSIEIWLALLIGGEG